VDLTTTDRVKKILVGQNSTGNMSAQQDPFIKNLITAVSKQAEEFMDRFAEETARTEFFDVEFHRQQVFFVKGYPISAVASVKYDFARGFGSGVSAIDTTNYNDAQFKLTGRLVVDKIALPRGVGALQVIYTGGMGTDTANFIVNFPDVSNAVDLQVAFIYQRRNQFSLSSTSQEGGSVSFTPPPSMNLLPGVRMVLTQVKRMRLG